MEAKFEKKLKAFLPYIIIIGIVYLIVPALLFVGSDFVSYLVLIGILPLTAAGCCAYYSMKKENDFWLCLVAPIFFIPAMFLYPIFRSGALIALIYLVSYLLCGYLGLTIGVLVSFLTLNKSFGHPITQVSQQANSIVMALAGAERVFALLDEEAEKDEGYVTLVNIRKYSDGQIIECGSPQELMAQKGKYYKLVQIQSMSDKVAEERRAENL